METLAGGKMRKHTPTGTIEENLKSRRTEAKLRDSRHGEGLLLSHLNYSIIRRDIFQYFFSGRIPGRLKAIPMGKSC